eukprot:1689788-Pleurochrysis_carterae.AAC.4
MASLFIGEQRSSPDPIVKAYATTTQDWLHANGGPRKKCTAAYTVKHALLIPAATHLKRPMYPL